MSSVNQSEPSIYQEFKNYMERDTKGVEIGICAVSGILFAVAYYKHRPITKFGKASDIPTRFIRDKVTQYGKVAHIEPGPTGPLVHINHKPPINLFFASKKTLPAKISGIEVNSNGFSWLQTVLVNKNVEFVPVTAESPYATVKLTLKDKGINQKPKNLDVAQALLSLGFARSDSEVPKVITTEKDKQLLKYYKYLLATEQRAKSRRLGLWSTTLPPQPWAIRTAQNVFDQFVVTITPPSKRLPGLLR